VSKCCESEFYFIFLILYVYLLFLYSNRLYPRKSIRIAFLSDRQEFNLCFISEMKIYLKEVTPR
jgi:hypothetical protein